MQVTQKPPAPTTCQHCGTVAAEIVCHLCKTERALLKDIRIHIAGGAPQFGKNRLLERIDEAMKSH